MRFCSTTAPLGEQNPYGGMEVRMGHRSRTTADNPVREIAASETTENRGSHHCKKSLVVAICGQIDKMQEMPSVAQSCNHFCRTARQFVAPAARCGEGTAASIRHSMSPPLRDTSECRFLHKVGAPENTRQKMSRCRRDVLQSRCTTARHEFSPSKPIQLLLAMNVIQDASSAARE